MKTTKKPKTKSSRIQKIKKSETKETFDTKKTKTKTKKLGSEPKKTFLQKNKNYAIALALTTAAIGSRLVYTLKNTPKYYKPKSTYYVTYCVYIN